MTNIIINTEEYKNRSTASFDKYSEQSNTWSLGVEPVSSIQNNDSNQSFIITSQSHSSVTSNSCDMNNYIQLEDFLIKNSPLISFIGTPGIFKVMGGIFSNSNEVATYLSEVFYQYGKKDQFFIKIIK